MVQLSLEDANSLHWGGKGKGVANLALSEKVLELDKEKWTADTCP